MLVNDIVCTFLLTVRILVAKRNEKFGALKSCYIIHIYTCTNLTSKLLTWQLYREIRVSPQFLRDWTERGSVFGTAIYYFLWTLICTPSCVCARVMTERWDGSKLFFYISGTGRIESWGELQIQKRTTWKLLWTFHVQNDLVPFLFFFMHWENFIIGGAEKIY